jgi:hypothetical protein
MEAGNPLLASIAYGYAKFPCRANDARREALENQLVSYLAAAPGFLVKFERRVIALSYRGAKVKLPAHLFSISAMTGLSGAVDAAIVLGGPVDKTFTEEVQENQ